MRSGLIIFLVLLFGSGCREEGVIVPPPDSSPPVPSPRRFQDSGRTLTIQWLSLDPQYATLYGVGNSLQLSAVLWSQEGEAPIVATILKWDSDNEAVATVDSEGRVKAVALGDALIIAHLGTHQAMARLFVVEVPEAYRPPSPSDEPPPSEDEPPPPSDEPPPSPVADEPPPSKDEPPLPFDEPPPSPVADETPPSPVADEPPPSPDAPYADRVVSYTIGPGGGLNEGLLPDIVLGPPHGQGLNRGGADIVSLGNGGEIILEFTDFIAVDGEGADITVFENAFQVGSNPDNTYAEPGIVSVSNDGVNFVEFPCDTTTRPYDGCAGVHPTLANPDINEIDPTDPAVSGGDFFDLAEIGLQSAQFIRIQDADVRNGPVGPNTAGFDLDAVAIIHGALP